MDGVNRPDISGQSGVYSSESTSFEDEAMLALSGKCSSRNTRTDADMLILFRWGGWSTLYRIGDPGSATNQPCFFPIFDVLSVPHRRGPNTYNGNILLYTRYQVSRRCSIPIVYVVYHSVATCKDAFLVNVHLQTSLHFGTCGNFV